MSHFQMGYTVLGGLGIFFLGMKFLSESLQALAGDVIRKVINMLTTNRFLALTVGTVVTMIVQSSSVTTVMVVGMVDAGLMGLTQAIGVIFGANIGTTITGWIIAIKVGKYGLLFVGLGLFPMFFAKSDKWKMIGKLWIALGLVFIGLNYMSDAFKPLRGDAEFQSYLHYFTADSYASVWGCIIIGCLLTFIIQSSSAMLGITISLALTGVISFQTGMALVLGENIGTTITAILASIGANTNAKRAARAHAFFNVFGVVIISTFFWQYIHFLEWLGAKFIPGSATFVNDSGEYPYVGAYIAAGHSFFNIINSIIFTTFLIKPLAKFVTWVTPGEDESDAFEFTAGKHPELSPALGLEHAQKGVEEMFKRMSYVLQLTKDYTSLENDDPKILDKIVTIEDEFDVYQKDLTLYICSVMESSLTAEQSSLGYSLIRISDELESISDYCVVMSKLYYKTLRDSKKHPLSTEAQNELRELLIEIQKYFEINAHKFYLTLNQDIVKNYKVEGSHIESQITRARKAHLNRMKEGSCSPVSGLFYSDMLMAAGRMKNHTVNVIDSTITGFFPDKAAA